MNSFVRAGAGAGAALAAYAWWRRQRLPVVVVGGGVMGLSTAERLARSGRRVLLIDAGHPIRGSWGVSRASHLRMEDPVLLKMSLFSIRRWLELQRQYAGAGLGSEEDALFYRRTGGMMAGPCDAIERLAESVRAELGALPEGQLEVLDGPRASERYPQLKLSEEEKAVVMPEGYTIVVPTCLECLRWAAARAGVEMEEGSVAAIDRSGRTVTTEGGRRVRYADLVVTAGPWTNQVLARAGLSGVPLFVSNEQTVELVPKEGAPSHDWDAFPLFTWSEAGYKGRGADGGCRYFYTTPHITLKSSGSAGVKIGFHRQGPLLDNEEFQVTEQAKGLKEKLPHVRKELNESQQYALDEFAWRSVQEFVSEKMPGLDASRYAGFMRCLYQCTPDLQMIVGRHPEDAGVILACGFSGSGFQFAPAVAERLAQLLGAAPSGATKEREMLQGMAAKFTLDRFFGRPGA